MSAKIHQELLDRFELSKVETTEAVNEFIRKGGKVKKIEQGACSEATNPYRKMNRKYPRYLPYRV